MKVGHLYFAGKGRFPGFYAADGTLFSELCWGDFAADSVLRDIAGYVEEAPDPMAAYSGATKGSASFALPEVVGGDASANTDAKVSGIKRVTLTAAGVQAVLSNLGPDCRTKIDEYSASHDVVLLMAAQRADKMILSAGGKLSFEASIGKLIGLTPVTAGAEANQTLEYQMVYLSSNLGSTKSGDQ